MYGTGISAYVRVFTAIIKPNLDNKRTHKHMLLGRKCETKAHLLADVTDNLLITKQ